MQLKHFPFGVSILSFPHFLHLILSELVPLSDIYSHSSQFGPPFFLALQYIQDSFFVLKNPCLHNKHLFFSIYSVLLFIERMQPGVTSGYSS